MDHRVVPLLCVVALALTLAGLRGSIPSSTEPSTRENRSEDVKAARFEALGDQTSRRVRGRLNAGGVPIELTAVNGNIIVESQ